MSLRTAMLARGVDPALRRAWYRDGYVVVPGAIDALTVARLRSEILASDVEVRECVQGDTLTHRMALDPASRPALPLSNATLDAAPISRLLRFAAAKATRPIAYVQTIRNNEVDGATDPQKTLHSDTFHPTMKSWLFLDDVDAANGPFTYVPGSHRPTRARLAWEYAKSVEIASGADRYSGNGSLRLTEEDRVRDGPAPSPSGSRCARAPSWSPTPTASIAAAPPPAGPRAPSCGRCRGATRSTRRRGSTCPSSTRCSTACSRRGRRVEDRRAAARGTVSSWHVVGPAEHARARRRARRGRGRSAAHRRGRGVRAARVRRLRGRRLGRRCAGGAPRRHRAGGLKPRFGPAPCDVMVYT